MLGQIVGSYRILSVLGEGGMGVVYLGEHTLLGRRAAIKVLLPRLSEQAELVQRFFNEARAVTQIADAGIVQVFDFGYHADGSAFIVMELLQGEPMDRRLARIGRFQPFDALRLLRLVCTSLAAAHAKGIVHRDLKPENIYLVSDPAVTGGERAKILDFGIAKLSADEPGKLKTRTGMMMGTPVYMSPEQCRGAGEVDPRSDIYSVGCVMMTMLTGRPPFEAEGSGELIAAHLREAPPLAAARIEGLPELCDQILQRCLAKSPADRFPTMTALAETLGHAEQMLLHSMAVTYTGELPSYAGSGLTPPPSLRTPTTLTGASGQASAPVRGRRAGVVAATLLAAVCLGIVGFMSRGASPSEPEGSSRAAAVQPVVAAPLDAALGIDAGSAPIILADAAIASVDPEPSDARAPDTAIRPSPRPRPRSRTPRPSPPGSDPGDPPPYAKDTFPVPLNRGN